MARYRSWAIACALATTFTLALVSCSQEASPSDATPSSQAGGSGDERVAAVYSTLLRYHVVHGLPMGEDQWNGVLYLPSATRANAISPMSASQPGDQPIPAPVRGQIERALMDVADVRWIEDFNEAALEPRDLRDRRCVRNPSTPVLVWLPPVKDGSEVELGISSWADCGLASGATYVLSEDGGTWTTSKSVPMWIT